MTLDTPQLHHIALTVSDVDASTAWYEHVFDLHHVADVPHEGGFAKLLADPADRVLFALHHHDSNVKEPFSETSTGLDHVGMAVAARADLEQWQQHLEQCGIARAAVADKPLTQSPIVDAPYASVLVFRDPDNIQLELFAPNRR